MIWKWLRDYFDSEVRAHAAKIRSWVQANHPRVVRQSVELVDDGDTRYVFRVLYETDQLERPALCLIAAIDRGSREVSELVGPDAEPYRVQARL